MIFTTPVFCFFFAIVFLAYYTIFKKCQWQFLLVASLFFYGYASPVYLVYLGATILISYFVTIGMEKKGVKSAKGLLVFLIFALLLLLFLCKYLTFFCEVFKINTIFEGNGFILPIGLSFYIFQTLGYVIDVYRGSVKAERNLFRHALYLSYFPHLLQGPLADYSDLSVQLYQRHVFDETEAICGIRRIVWGFFKKLVIANQISVVIDPIWENVENNYGIVLLMALVLYAVQLYADFSGYMDIALGCSQMLGIKLDENFDLPYFSKNIPEYWRRWHITLGRWFRTYVYYPILRNKLNSSFRAHYRKKHPYASTTVPTVGALFITWLLIGLWHGANWGYVAHGLFHGFFIIMSVVLAPLYKKFHKQFPKLKEKYFFRWFQILRTFIIVLIGYSLFRPADLSVTMTFYRNLGSSGIAMLISLLIENYRPILILFMGTVILWIADFYQNKKGIPVYIMDISAKKSIRIMVYVLFLCVIVVFGEYNQNSVSQFAYFRF